MPGFSLGGVERGSPDDAEQRTFEAVEEVLTYRALSLRRGRGAINVGFMLHGAVSLGPQRRREYHRERRLRWTW